MRVGNNGVLLSVQDAVDTFRVPAGTLRRWAIEDGWTRFGGPRSCHWRAEEVQASYDARRLDNSESAPNTNR